MLTTTGLITVAVVTAAICPVVASAATTDLRDHGARPAVGTVDLRSPDARDRGAGPAVGTVDLRSPNARDHGARPAVGSVDLRSPDARDHGARPVVGSADLRSPDARLGYPTGVALSAPVPSAGPPADGFAWGDAAIGAGGALVIVALALGGGVLAAGRRRSRVPKIAVG